MSPAKRPAILPARVAELVRTIAEREGNAAAQRWELTTKAAQVDRRHAERAAARKAALLATYSPQVRAAGEDMRAAQETHKAKPTGTQAERVAAIMAELSGGAPTTKGEGSRFSTPAVIARSTAKLQSANDAHHAKTQADHAEAVAQQHEAEAKRKRDAAQAKRS